MPKLDTNAQNMPGHAARTHGGRLRKIRGDTEIKTLEKRYNVDLGVRDDMRWDTFKKEKGIESVKDALEKFTK
ncbi:MAG: hypothetical protein WC849_03310 [Candidatus Paceibacterota bacterium]